MSKKTFREAVRERTIRNGNEVYIQVIRGKYILPKEVSGLEEDKKLETPNQIKWKVAEINGKTGIMAITPIKVAFSKNSIRDVQDVADEICRELFSSELFQSVENFNFIVGFESRRIYGSCYSEMGWKSDTITFAVQPVVVLKDGVTVENCATGEKLGKEGHPWILSLK